MDLFLIAELKFTSTPSGPCLFVKYSSGTLIIIYLYVYDLILARNDLAGIGWLKRELSRRFEIKDPEEAKVCLGLKIIRDRSTKNFLSFSSQVQVHWFHPRKIQKARLSTSTYTFAAM